MTLFATIDHEHWLAKRLGEHGAGVFTGLTDRDVRRERLRAAILEHGLEAVIVGRGKNGKPEPYSAAFERLYGEPLVASNKRQPQRAPAAPNPQPHEDTTWPTANP